MQAILLTYIHMCIHTRIHTQLNFLYAQRCRPSCLHTYICAYIHTYIPSWISSTPIDAGPLASSNNTDSSQNVIHTNTYVHTHEHTYYIHTELNFLEAHRCRPPCFFQQCRRLATRCMYVCISICMYAGMYEFMHVCIMYA